MFISVLNFQNYFWCPTYTLIHPFYYFSKVRIPIDSLMLYHHLQVPTIFTRAPSEPDPFTCVASSIFHDFVQKSICISHHLSSCSFLISSPHIAFNTLSSQDKHKHLVNLNFPHCILSLHISHFLDSLSIFIHTNPYITSYSYIHQTLTLKIENLQLRKPKNI